MGLILAMLCGCGQRQSVSAEKETDRIVIWTWDDTFNVKAAKLAAKEYKKTHKDIQIIVETKEREEILADTKNLIASKMYQELPDVIMIEDYDIQDVLSQYEDEFVDLTDKVDYDRYTDYKSKLCSKGDRFYGIPFDSGTAALFYRLDILEQAGYTEVDMQDPYLGTIHRDRRGCLSKARNPDADIRSDRFATASYHHAEWRALVCG